MRQLSKLSRDSRLRGDVTFILPPLLLITYLGGEMFDASGKMQRGAWPILAGLFATSLVIALRFRSNERRSTA